MVLTPEEQAQLDALTAKAAEPAPEVPHKRLTVAADVLDTVRQLVQVHFAQIAGDVYSRFMQAVDEAEDVADPAAPVAAPEPEPEPEPEPAAPEPEPEAPSVSELSPPAAGEASVSQPAEPEPFGTEAHEM